MRARGIHLGSPYHYYLPCYSLLYFYAHRLGEFRIYRLLHAYKKKEKKKGWKRKNVTA